MLADGSLRLVQQLRFVGRLLQDRDRKRSDTNSPGDTTMNSAFVGRQPIYTPDLQLAAYEVLFRDSDENACNVEDGDQATAELILNLFAEIGLEQIVGKFPAFINVTQNFIVDGHAYSLPKDRIVLEVLEDVRPTPEVIEALRRLSSEGYTIALDDFVYASELQPLVDVADIVKVELPAIAKDDLPRHVKLLRRNNLKLLAEKVETYDEFEHCKDLGFDYFQGYFFCKPKVIKGTRLPVNRIAALRLLTQLSQRQVRIDELADILSTEPSLCYKLLRFVNSASCALSRRVDSIQAAVALVGLRRLSSFARLALLTRVTDKKPPHLIITALTRARMCELLAKAARAPRPDRFFIAGLFSVLDALLDKPMPEALLTLPLEQEIHDALLGQDGPMAEIVQCVLSYDQAAFESVHLESVDSHTIRNSYLDAVVWAAESSSAAAQLS